MYVFRLERTIFKLKQAVYVPVWDSKGLFEVWLAVAVRVCLMTSEAISDAMAFDLTNSDVRRGNGCGFSDVRGFRWHGK